MLSENEAMRDRLFSLIDHTTLSETDTVESVTQFCQTVSQAKAPVAAVCVYPAFVPLVNSLLIESPIRVATVVNFPSGSLPLETVLVEIQMAIAAGAQEIDMVLPYLAFLAGQQAVVSEFVATCRQVCGPTITLKIILETGYLKTPALIAEASRLALTAGANFIKTSTGKIPEGATLEAATVMLGVIREMASQLPQRIGLKVSGGIREIDQAVQYVKLAERVMGSEWVSPETMRIGSSQLVDRLLG